MLQCISAVLEEEKGQKGSEQSFSSFLATPVPKCEPLLGRVLQYQNNFADQGAVTFERAVASWSKLTGS